MTKKRGDGDLPKLLRQTRKNIASLNEAADGIDTQLVRFDGENAAIDFNVDWAHETLWASQRQMADLFGKDTDTIGHHIGQLYDSGEFERETTTAKFAVVRLERGRSVSREIEHHNLDVILVVGYRVNGTRAAQFRKWANGVLKRYISEGFALDHARLDSDEAARDAAIAELRRLRANDKTIYRKLTDAIATTSYDYQWARENEPHKVPSLFARLQDTFHVAVCGKTAQQLVCENADGSKPLVGMLSFDGDPTKITLQDVRTGKNYLDENPFRRLENLYDQLFLFAEQHILRGEHMSLAIWEERLLTLLKANGYEAFTLYSTYRATEADETAKRELGKFKDRQKLAAA